MNEIAGISAGGVFALRAPADIACTREDVGDCLLLAVMMNSGTGSRLDFKQAAPHR